MSAVHGSIAWRLTLWMPLGFGQERPNVAFDARAQGLNFGALLGILEEQGLTVPNCHRLQCGEAIQRLKAFFAAVAR